MLSIIEQIMCMKFYFHSYKHLKKVEKTFGDDTISKIICKRYSRSEKNTSEMSHAPVDHPLQLMSNTRLKSGCFKNQFFVS